MNMIGCFVGFTEVEGIEVGPREGNAVGANVGNFVPLHAPTTSHVSLHKSDDNPPGAYVKLPQLVPMHWYIIPSRDTSVPML